MGKPMSVLIAGATRGIGRVADGSSAVVWVDYTTQKLAPLPDDFKQETGETDRVGP